jgi:anti-anti-sigma factor
LCRSQALLTDLGGPDPGRRREWRAASFASTLDRSLGLRALKDAAPLVVVRRQADSGGVELQLIGELDLNTVALLQAEVASSRERLPPAVIDLSELRFLDLAGLRALVRIGKDDGAAATRLVGATGIVRRLIDLTRALDAESGTTDSTRFPAEVTGTVVCEELPASVREVGGAISNGSGSRIASKNSLNGAAPGPRRRQGRPAR